MMFSFKKSLTTINYCLPVVNHDQPCLPSSTIINHDQGVLTIINHYRRLSLTTTNHDQPFSPPYSTIINTCQPSSTISSPSFVIGWSLRCSCCVPQIQIGHLWFRRNSFAWEYLIWVRHGKNYGRIITSGLEVKPMEDKDEGSVAVDFTRYPNQSHCSYSVVPVSEFE